MEVTFIDTKNPQNLAAVQPKEGDALMGFNLDNDGKLTKEGVPQHKLYTNQKIVSFGVQRFQRQEERNSLMSVAGQALSFRKQNPRWQIAHIYRPIYDINPDDTLAAAILDEEIGTQLLENSVKLHALVAEVAVWNSNKYMHAKEFRPSLLNNLLNEFPYPFKDTFGKTRQESCAYYFYDQQAYFSDNIERMEPVTRVFPLLRYDVLAHNAKSALILVQSDRYGSDDLIAQMYFQGNPDCSRVVLVRQVFKSVKHLVMVANSNLYDDNLVPFSYPNIKELNSQEKRADGDPTWKNLKLTSISPRKGTALAFDVIWDLTRIETPEEAVSITEPDVLLD
jgi:hypothetical protein